MGRTTRILTVVAAMAALVALTGAIAVAQEVYPPDSPATASVQKDSIAPGDIQRITFTGLQPGSTGNLTVTGPDGRQISMTETVGADGTVTFEFRIPADWPAGTATWVFTGIDEEGNDVTITGSFVIDPTLPITGAGISRMALSAGLLLFAGAGLVLYARRRRSVEAAIAGLS